MSVVCVSRNSVGRVSRPARSALLGRCLAAALALSILPAGAQAQRLSDPIQSAIADADGADREVRAFYRANGYRPLWIMGSAIGPQADYLLELLATSDRDGLDPDKYRLRTLATAIRRADRGSPKALARAEMLLSNAFATYVRDARTPRGGTMHYVDAQLAPTAPGTAQILRAAASARSLEQYLRTIGWMHPLYAPLRDAMDNASPERARILRLNLDRARALPAPDAGGRHILVDAAGQRLYMYDNGRVVDSMRVVVGKPSEPTPIMAGLIRFTMVNPYWNVPPDLARKTIAANVLDQGHGYLKSRGYQLLSGWSEDATILKPSEVDWDAVAAGAEQLRVRQLPGPGNAMGKMKFMFPNRLGIYLHDTPDKALLKEDDRMFSAGCVRLEDAPRLAKWLYGKPLTTKSKKPEQRVDMPAPVPVYITYLTAAPENGRIAWREDVYNRDGAQLARAGSAPIAAR